MNTIFRCIFKSDKSPRLFLNVCIAFLLISPVKNVVASNAADFSITEAQSVQITLYAGTVEGVDGSWARITKVNNQFSGAIFDGYELYMLDSGKMVADSVDASLKEVMQDTEVH